MNRFFLKELYMFRIVLKIYLIFLVSRDMNVKIILRFYIIFVRMFFIKRKVW